MLAFYLQYRVIDVAKFQRLSTEMKQQRAPLQEMTAQITAQKKIMIMYLVWPKRDSTRADSQPSYRSTANQ